MFLVKKWCTRVVAVTTLAALLPLATASADYWDTGTRYNGVSANGYWLSASIGEWDCETAVTLATQHWQTISLHVTFNHLYAMDDWERGGDRYYARGSIFTGDKPDLRVMGETRIYGREPNNSHYELEKKFPDVKNLLTGKQEHTPTCYHNKNWEFCTVALYRATIENYAREAGTNAEAELENTATHEIGHTLRLAHPPTGLLTQDGEGTGDGVNQSIYIGDRSVMERKVNLVPLPATPVVNSKAPTQYDKDQLKAKWGI